MELLWLYIVLGVVFVLAVVALITRHIHGRTPSQGFGDYFFDPKSHFDLNLFPSLVLGKDAIQLKILQLADPHLKLGFMPRGDRKTVRLIKRAVLSERPDLCIVTGDLSLSVFPYHAIRYFSNFMQKLGVKWAYVFGNHDAHSGCSKYTISKLLKKYANCIFSVGASNIDGKGNYVINVYKGEKSAENLAYSLFMLDSGSYATDGVKRNVNQYGCIRQSQINWYAWAVNGLRAINPKIQSSMFFHIPLKEFANMYYLREQELGHEIPESVRLQLKNVKIHDVKGTVCETSKKKAALVQGDEGYTAGIYYQGRANDESSIFSQIKNLDCTKAVFCAHDHANTLKGYYDGVYLAYGLCCGYHTYPYFKKFPSKSVVLNGALWVDENGRKMSKGVTMISISLADDYGELSVLDKQAGELKKVINLPH